MRNLYFSFLKRFILLLLLLPVLVLAACAGDGDGGEIAVAADATATPLSSPMPSETAVSQPATFTPVPTLTLTPTPGPSPTPSRTPRPSPTPTKTPVPTATPTSVPQQSGSVVVYATPDDPLAATPVTPIPTAVPTFVASSSVTNILLLGSDNATGQGMGRTDTIIVASVNRETKTASMISLPRDLYVYIPNRGMGTINTVGSNTSGDSGGPFRLLEATILYNFGIPIHYYALVDFDGFKTVVDAIGGVDIPISCSFEDHRLISADLDPEEEESWELFRVDPGIHHMDGETALWYVRSRERLEADWGRTKRQQQMLRALFNHGIDVGLLAEVPTLYNVYREAVDTDLDIGRVLQLASVAPAVRENGIQHLYIRDRDIIHWTVPSSPPKNVLLPNWEQLQYTFYSLMSPSELFSGSRAPIFVEIVNGTGNPDLALLAADNLAWYGFVPVITTADRDDYDHTTITYYGANLKGTFVGLLTWIFHQREGNVEVISDTPSDYDYRVVLGADYDPCLNQFYAPRQ